MNDQKTVCHIWKNNNNYLTSREIEKKRYWSNILPAVYLYTAIGCDRKQLRIKRYFFFLRIAEKQMKDQMRRDEIQTNQQLSIIPRAREKKPINYHIKWN